MQALANRERVLGSRCPRQIVLVLEILHGYRFALEVAHLLYPSGHRNEIICLPWWLWLWQHWWSRSKVSNWWYGKVILPY